MQSIYQINKTPFNRTGKSCRIATAVVCLTFAVAGCGKGETGPTAQQLLRQQQLRSSQKASATQTTQQRLDTALAFLKDDNFIAAGEELSRILIADPNNQKALILSARVEAAQGNVSAAVKVLDSLDNTDSTLNTEILWLAADWSTESGDYSTAEQKLKDLLKVEKDLVKVHRQLAIILNNQELVTLLCSPTGLNYLAVGFLSSEGLIKSKDEIKKITVDDQRGVVRVETGEDKEFADIFKRFITSGCGRGASFSITTWDGMPRRWRATADRRSITSSRSRSAFSRLRFFWLP